MASLGKLTFLSAVNRSVISSLIVLSISVTMLSWNHYYHHKVAGEVQNPGFRQILAVMATVHQRAGDIWAKVRAGVNLQKRI